MRSRFFALTLFGLAPASAGFAGATGHLEGLWKMGVADVKDQGLRVTAFAEIRPGEVSSIGICEAGDQKVGVKVTSKAKISADTIEILEAKNLTSTLEIKTPIAKNKFQLRKLNCPASHKKVTIKYALDGDSLVESVDGEKLTLTRATAQDEALIRGTKVIDEQTP